MAWWAASAAGRNAGIIRERDDFAARPSSGEDPEYGTGH
jgi:hypothetical protein